MEAWLTLQDPAPDFEGTLTLPVLTGSMAPYLPLGCELVIAAATRRRFGVGDVVVFTRDDRLVAHRVLVALGRGPDAWLFEKGDGNAAGRWIRRREVKGVGVDRQGPGITAASPALRSRRAALRSLLRAVAARIRPQPAAAATSGGDQGEERP